MKMPERGNVQSNFVAVIWWLHYVIIDLEAVGYSGNLHQFE